MSARRPWGARAFETFGLVRVSHTFEDLSAHVELEGDLAIEPGDEVLVHGPRFNPPYGQVQVERRPVTVTRAGWLATTWTRLTGDLDCLSLLEISFSEGRPS